MLQVHYFFGIGGLFSLFHYANEIRGNERKAA